MNPAATSRRDALRMARPFAALGDADCDAVLAVLRARQGLPGDVLFAQGDPGDTLMVIAEGTLAARVRRPSGVEVELARFGRGDIVGELALIDAQPRSATLVAVERTVVYELSREGVATLARVAPTVVMLLLRSIVDTAARRLRVTTGLVVRQLDGAAKLDAAPRSGHAAPAPAPPSTPAPAPAPPPRRRTAPVADLGSIPPPLSPSPSPAPPPSPSPSPSLSTSLPDIPELDVPRRPR